MSRAGNAGGLFMLVLLVASACDVQPDYLKESARKRRIEALGVEHFDSAGAFKLAGLSTHREIKISALRPREVGADTLSPEFHVYHMRCGSCHDAPSPGSRPGYLWEASMSRMKKNAQDAGLLPITAEDQAAVLRFLRRHASDAAKSR